MGWGSGSWGWGLVWGAVFWRQFVFAVGTSGRWKRAVCVSVWVTQVHPHSRLNSHHSFSRLFFDGFNNVLCSHACGNCWCRCCCADGCLAAADLISIFWQNPAMCVLLNCLFVAVNCAICFHRISNAQPALHSPAKPQTPNPKPQSPNPKP